MRLGQGRGSQHCPSLVLDILEEYMRRKEVKDVASIV
jgi:hypothetical protein